MGDDPPDWSNHGGLLTHGGPPFFGDEAATQYKWV